MTGVKREGLARHLGDVSKSYLVVCPKCSACAQVTFVGGYQVSCSSCGHIQVVQKKPRSRSNNASESDTTVYGLPIDPCLRLPLWLQIDFRGKILWAYNWEHLAYLEEYIAAKHRPAGPPGARTLGGKLPAWIGNAKNRDDLLKAITQLRARALSA